MVRRSACWSVLFLSLMVTAAGPFGCRTDETRPKVSSDCPDCKPSPDGATTTPPDPVDAGGPPDAKPLRVLFVGNSYTYVNDLPAVVHALGAATPGAAVDVSAVTVGGATLESLWTADTARASIASGGFDSVVLQGNSLEALGEATRFFQYAALFGDAVRDAGARTVWYATWARRAGDSIYASGMTTPEFMMRSIDHSYRKAAEVSGGIVARAGVAWQLSRAEHPGVELYDPDGSHPAPAGTLLTACTMFLALTGKEAVLPEPAPLGIDRATATALCALAPRALCGASGCLCENAVQRPTTYTALHALAPACDGATGRFDLECATAMAATCAASPCTNSGFGTASPAGDAADLTCVAGTKLATSFAALQAFDSGCDGTTERYGPHCAKAIDQACAATGALSGFGPTAIAGSVVTVTCVPAANAMREHLRFEQLQAIAFGCDGTTQSWGPDCNVAIERFCRTQGFAGGFGPTATSGMNADAVCVAW